MKLRVNVPVIFHASVTRSSGMRSILTFVESELDVQEVTEMQAPLAVVHAVRPNVFMRHYRIVDDRLYSAIIRPNNPDPTDPLVKLAFGIEQALAKAACEELRQVGLADVHPRDAIDMLDNIVKPDSSGKGIQARRELYLTAAAGKADNTRIRNLVAASADFDAMCAKWKAKAAALLSDHVLVGGHPFRISNGMAVQVACRGPQITLNELDVDASEIVSVEGWATPPNKTKGGSFLYQGSYFYSSADLDDAIAHAQEVAVRKNGHVQFEASPQPEYFLPRSMVPSIDMRYPELVRAAKSVAFVVGSEIARRFKNRELAGFADDPHIRYAFDRLRDVLVTVNPYGEPDERLDASLSHLLSTMRADPTKTNATYRNVLTKRAEIYERADTALGVWDERPLEVSMGRSPMPGHRP